MSEESSSKPRLNLQDCRSQDLVSRLLAATPPYLYSAPTGPHSFFFSEMLRSLVQAKTNNEAAALRSSAQTIQSQPNIVRRPRKRSWSQHRPVPFEARKPLGDDKEKPLELTTKHSAFSSPKSNENNSENKMFIQMPENSNKYSRTENEKPSVTQSNNLLSNSTSTTSTSSPPPAVRSPSDLALPPPPPMWYPPIYPPYGIDPLHFFIDLRVSSHIYDRKKENTSPTALRPENNNSLFTESESLLKCRQNSAFSVPMPKESSAVNLTSTSSHDRVSGDKKLENDYDLNDYKENNSKNTNYVLQNLPRIYTNLTTTQQRSCGDLDENNSNELDERKFKINSTTDNEGMDHLNSNLDFNEKFIPKKGGCDIDDEDDEPITIEEID